MKAKSPNLYPNITTASSDCFPPEFYQWKSKPISKLDSQCLDSASCLTSLSEAVHSAIYAGLDTTTLCFYCYDFVLSEKGRPTRRLFSYTAFDSFVNTDEVRFSETILCRLEVAKCLALITTTTKPAWQIKHYDRFLGFRSFRNSQMTPTKRQHWWRKKWQLWGTEEQQIAEPEKGKTCYPLRRQVYAKRDGTLLWSYRICWFVLPVWKVAWHFESLLQWRIHDSSNSLIPRLNIVNYKPSPEQIKQNHFVSTAVQTMYIMGDLSAKDRQAKWSEEQ